MVTMMTKTMEREERVEAPRGRVREGASRPIALRTAGVRMEVQ
jgi:hypothetical protein